MNKDGILKDMDIILGRLEILMMKHGIKNVSIWKNAMMQEVVISNGEVSENIVFQKRTNKEWEEMKKVR